MDTLRAEKRAHSGDPMRVGAMRYIAIVCRLLKMVKEVERCDDKVEWTEVAEKLDESAHLTSATHILTPLSCNVEAQVFG